MSWDWTQVSRTIGKHSIHKANEVFGGVMVSQLDLQTFMSEFEEVPVV